MMILKKNRAPIQLLTVFLELQEGVQQKVGRLAQKNREILFEYDADFINRGLELSPFNLPLASGVKVGDPAIFQGLMGVFEDSLPDGWGRLLLERRIARAGRLRRDLWGPWIV
ncbi:HipA N-terminal domain-containing protein [Bdellovibrionota bacterium FG-1]